MDDAPRILKTCPICRKHPAVLEYKPFCSKRCADVDLGRWLHGAYVISGAPEMDENGDQSQMSDRERDDV
ncbi:MAG: DNA gyrase inhibitor YacG [Hyphomicrobiales bacterium]|nr:DNA gyrase inhibitor YacG [Hyphomicrobiales bacterium]